MNCNCKYFLSGHFLLIASFPLWLFLCAVSINKHLESVLEDNVTDILLCGLHVCSVGEREIEENHFIDYTI